MAEDSKTTPKDVELTLVKAHQWVVAGLTAAGFPPIPVQMIYNYTGGMISAGKKPLIPFRRNEEGKIRIKKSDLEVWFTKHLNRKVEKRQALQAELTTTN